MKFFKRFYLDARRFIREIAGDGSVDVQGRGSVGRQLQLKVSRQ